MSDAGTVLVLAALAKRVRERPQKGDAGSNGRDGEQGLPGPVGPQGPQGEEGPQGERGEQGPQGERGADGRDGKDGLDGVDGKNGPRGPAGPRGERGEQGEPGKQGEAGPTGPKGEKGAPGPKGADGVGFTWRGRWSGGARYEENDVVEHNGSSWTATRPTVAQAPGFDGSGWDLVAVKGKNGGGGGVIVSGGGGVGSSLTVRSVSADTAVALNEVLLVNATAGTVFVTLPNPADGSGTLYIKKTNASGGDVHINGPIDGGTFLVLLTDRPSVQLASDGLSAWWII